MAAIPTLPGISSKMVQTDRLNQNVLFSGNTTGIPVLFIHGNGSSATFWEETMLSLPNGFRGIAPDLRGYGETEDLPIDARRGMGDWIDDLNSLLIALNIAKVHLVGHSMGGTIVFSALSGLDAEIVSATVVDPGSPFGFGGTKDIYGTPCYDDFAGSGGGMVNPEFPRLMASGDRSSNHPQASPRVVMNQFYWKPPFVPEREEALLSSLLAEKTGNNRYPGDFVSSPNWPNVAPGIWGPINALSPKYRRDSVEKLWSLEQKPEILWIRGDSDLIVSDQSLFDFGILGQMGLIPGWPGNNDYPPQPMVSQTRYILEKYREHGGVYYETVIQDAGHSPFIEKPAAFMKVFNELLKK